MTDSPSLDAALYGTPPPDWPQDAPEETPLPAQPGATWQPVDLAKALAGGCVEPPPVLLTREDGRRLLYAGKVHTVSGESESLKTWLVLLACASVLSDGGHVLFVDYEDGPGGIAGRLLALGCPPQAILDRLHYVRPDEPFSPGAAHVLNAALPGPRRWPSWTGSPRPWPPTGSTRSTMPMWPGSRASCPGP